VVPRRKRNRTGADVKKRGRGVRHTSKNAEERTGGGEKRSGHRHISGKKKEKLLGRGRGEGGTPTTRKAGGRDASATQDHTEKTFKDRSRRGQEKGEGKG